MLKDFVLEGAPLEVPDTRKMIPIIKDEIDKARGAAKPVIYICDAHAPDDKEFKKFGWPAHAVKGTRGAEVIEELKPGEEDIVIRKTTYSGFYGTGLDETLKRLGVDSLRLTGDVTHICVLFTASDAVLRDYAVTVVEDGVAGLSKEDHDAALRIHLDLRHGRAIRIGRRGSHARAAIPPRAPGRRVRSHRADRPLGRLRRLHGCREREAALGIRDIEHAPVRERHVLQRHVELLRRVPRHDLPGSLGRLQGCVPGHERDTTGVASQFHRREIGIRGHDADVARGKPQHLVRDVVQG